MKKIAIKIDNKRQFDALMKHYESKGWRSVIGLEPKDWYKEGIPDHYYQDVIEYQDEFAWPSHESNDYSKYTILDFSTFSQLTGGEVVNEVIVRTVNFDAICTPNSITLTGLRCDKQLIFSSELEEIYTAYKSLQS